MNLKQFFSISSPIESLTDQKEIDSKYKAIIVKIVLIIKNRPIALLSHNIQSHPTAV